MLKDNWLERQLATVKELLEQGRQGVKDNKLVEAEARLKEAGLILDSAETITPAVLKMRYVVYSEMATIGGRTGDAAAALGNYRRALEACEKLAAEHDTPSSLEIATTCVNLGGIYAGIGRLQDAEDVSRRAIDVVKAMPDGGGEHGLLMSVFANYHLGVVQHAGPTPEDSYEALARAVEGADQLTGNANKTSTPLVVECLTRLANLAARAERFDEAVERETRAAEMSLAIFEDTRQQTFLQGYLNCLMRLVGYCEAARSFADAEDAIFKMLELAPGHPEIIKRAKAFYEHILAMSDEELEAGNLPREEAEESFKEITGG